MFQWLWLEDLIAAGVLPADADQFNSLHEKLVDRFRAIFPNGGFVHFASDPDFVEDRQTVRYPRGHRPPGRARAASSWPSTTSA